MDKEVARLTKANEEVAKELATVKSAATTWEERALAAEAQAKDREASDGVIQEQAAKYKELEDTVFKDCRRILGVDDAHVIQLSAVDCVHAMFDSCLNSTADARALLQSVSPTEIIPASYLEVSECVYTLPKVVEWQQRSAYRRGAAQGLALGKAHFPWDWDHNEMSSGWPSETGAVDHNEVLKLKTEAAPYADRLLRMDDLLPYQSTLDALSDSPAKHRDHNIECPFEFARKGVLTTFPVSRWLPAYKRRQAAKDDEAGSSKATDRGKVDGGKEGE